MLELTLVLAFSKSAMKGATLNSFLRLLQSAFSEVK